MPGHETTINYPEADRHKRTRIYEHKYLENDLYGYSIFSKSNTICEYLKKINLGSNKFGYTHLLFESLVGMFSLENLSCTTRCKFYYHNIKFHTYIFITYRQKCAPEPGTNVLLFRQFTL